MTWQQVSQARVYGKEPIPLFTELLEEFPDAFLNIDSKSDPTVDPLIDILQRCNALSKVCIGSFSHRRISKFREILGARSGAANGFPAAAVAHTPCANEVDEGTGVQRNLCL